MPNYNNPFNYNTFNPTNPTNPTYYPSYQRNTYAFVNGIEGAKSYLMQPNQTVLLMDSDDLKCYMKQSDSLGRASIRTFKLEEVIDNPAPTTNTDYVTKSDFDALAKKVEELLKGGKEHE